jgi:hypothetical protein
MPETSSWDWHSTPKWTCYLSHSNVSKLLLYTSCFFGHFCIGPTSAVHVVLLWLKASWCRSSVWIAPVAHFLLFQCDCHLNSEFKVCPPKTLKVKTSGSHWNKLRVFGLFFNSIWCFYGEVWNILLKSDNYLGANYKIFRWWTIVWMHFFL